MQKRNRTLAPIERRHTKPHAQHQRADQKFGTPTAKVVHRERLTGLDAGWPGPEFSPVDQRQIMKRTNLDAFKGLFAKRAESNRICVLGWHRGVGRFVHRRREHDIGPARKMKIRGISKDDFDYIASVLDTWWGGPGRRADPMFFYEFGEHALVAESEDGVIGFLLGVHVPGPPRTGYIHLVGIHPDHRRRGVGRELYTQFMERCKAAGVERIKAIAAAGHEGPLKFHLSLGFSAEQMADYAGPGRARMVFAKAL